MSACSRSPTHGKPAGAAFFFGAHSAVNDGYGLKCSGVSATVIGVCVGFNLAERDDFLADKE